MDNTKKPQINQKLLTSEQRDKLENYQHAQKQLQTLQDIADISQELLGVVDTLSSDEKSTSHNIGALLTDMRESLMALKDKEMPEMPDHAKPVVEAVSKLEKAITLAISKIDVKPVIDAPQVNVSPPSVDLKGVEKAVKEIPKAFAEAVKLMPKVEISEQDNSELLAAWRGISEQLVSIENATRMKPIPGSMTISNLADTPGITNAELRATPINVDTGTQKDIFGYQVIVQPYNQIELRGDDTDWASFVTETNLNGGDTAQASGLLNITSSTATNGSAILSSLDTVRYRPGVGVYGAGTMIFTAGVTGSNQYFGLGTSTAFANGVQFGYKGTSFGIRYMRGGVEQSFTAQADWDDPCLGAATSNFTRAGVAEALDPTKDNLYRFEAGLFGFAGWKAQVWSPDNGWITVYTHEHINTGTTPVFELNTFYMVASNVKTSGATNISMKTQCWAAGTGTALIRVGSTITDRSLAAPVIATLQAKNPAGVHGAINRTTGGNLKISVQEISDGLDIGAGNAGSETQRVSISTDDVNLSAIKTATAAIQAAQLPDGHNVTIDNPGDIGTPSTYTTRIDEASATVTYIGDAAIGSATSGALWRIKKIDTTSGTSITFADGDGNFNNIWDNRAALTYS